MTRPNRLIHIPESYWLTIWFARVDSMVEQGYLEEDAIPIASAEVRARQLIAKDNLSRAVLAPGRIVWTFEDDLQFGLEYPDGFHLLEILREPISPVSLSLLFSGVD